MCSSPFVKKDIGESQFISTFKYAELLVDDGNVFYAAMLFKDDTNAQGMNDVGFDG